MGSLGLQPSRYCEILDVVEDTIDIHHVPAELAAMSDYNTIDFPACDELSN